MEALLTSVAGAAASALVGGLMTKKQPTPEAPKVEPPTPMPDPMAQKAVARRKQAISMSNQLSSANTVLTGGDKLGA